MAFAILHGGTIFDGWECKHPACVLYLHANKGCVSLFQEKLQIVKGIFSSKYDPDESVQNQWVGSKASYIFHDQGASFHGMDISETSMNAGWVSHTMDFPGLAMDILDLISKEKQQNPQRPVVVFLDGFDFMTNTSGGPARNVFLRDLKNGGCAVVIIPPGDMTTRDEIVRLKRRLALESWIRVESVVTDDATVGMLINVERGFKIGKGDARYIKVKLNTTVPKLEIVRDKRPMAEQISLIRRLRTTKPEITNKEIAEKLDISLALANKRMLQIHKMAGTKPQRGRRPNPPARAAKRPSTKAKPKSV
jgi:hypothetical protein